MTAPADKSYLRRTAANNVWLAPESSSSDLTSLPTYELTPEILASEELVGQAMLAELEAIAAAKDGDIVMLLLGGRGAQALHRLLGERAQRGRDELISRLCVFTQDALAPMRMDNGLSFVRDFERLLGDAFFRQVKIFTPMQTETDDLEAGLVSYLQQLEALGGVDIFFLGHGPEPNDASHLAYIRAGSGASVDDVAGLIPISASILEHHISKFKAGGSIIKPEDESECRQASHILTLGPAAILKARRVVQSVVDAGTAPAKRRTFRRVMETIFSDDRPERAQQLDENPGLWIRLHPNCRSLILPDLL